MKYQRGGGLPKLGQCLTSPVPAVNCHLKKAQADNATLTSMHNNGAVGGGRRRRGGEAVAPVCPTAPGVPTISPTYAAGANAHMSPNGNHNIYAGLKLQAAQKANAQNDSVAGWKDVNTTQAGGSALGHFVENLNNMAGGNATMCRHIDSQDRCRVNYESCIHDRSMQREDIRRLLRENDALKEFIPKAVEEADLLGLDMGAAASSRRYRRHRRRRKSNVRKNKSRKKRKKRGGDSAGPGSSKSDGESHRTSLDDGRHSSGSFGGGGNGNLKKCVQKCKDAAATARAESTMRLRRTAVSMGLPGAKMEHEARVQSRFAATAVEDRQKQREAMKRAAASGR